MTFSDKLKQRCKEIDENMKTNIKPRYDEEPAIEDIEKVQQPAGAQLWAVYKRTNYTHSPLKYVRLYMGLTEAEADRWVDWYNAKEQKQRCQDEIEAHQRGLEYLPDNVVSFDKVLQDSEQTSPYWNPRPVIKSEEN